MTLCIVYFPDCAECQEAHQYWNGDEHTCTEWCEILRDTRQVEGHAGMHEPSRCRDCNGAYTDRIGRTRYLRRLCGWKRCEQWLCPNCKRYQGGYGTIMCPCDIGRCGHRTMAEFRKPHPPTKRHAARTTTPSQYPRQRRTGTAKQRGGRRRAAHRV